MLLGIRVRNFEMLRDTRVGVVGAGVQNVERDVETALAAGRPPAIPLAPLTALIGRNDTGKSSLFHAMRFLSDAVRHGVRYASTQHGRRGFTQLRSHGGAGPVTFDLAVQLPRPAATVRYQVAFDCDRFGRPHVAHETVSHLQADGAAAQPLLQLKAGRGCVHDGASIPQTGVGNEDATGLGTYGAIVSHPHLHALYAMITRWFFCSFLPAEGEGGTDAAVATGGHRHLAPDGNNVENVLLYHREENPALYARVMAHIRDQMPGRLPIDEAVLSGRGSVASRRLFSYLLLLADPHPRPLLCIDSPDEGLYHEMVAILAGELRDYSLRPHAGQTLFTTHNPHLLEAMSPDEVWVFARQTLPPDAGVETAVARCAGADPVVRALYAEGVGMGSLWYSGHFEPEANHAP